MRVNIPDLLNNVDVGELHIFSTEETTLCHHGAHGTGCPPAPANICLTAGMTPAAVCFLAIDIPATENNIFISKQ